MKNFRRVLLLAKSSLVFNQNGFRALLFGLLIIIGSQFVFAAGERIDAGFNAGSIIRRGYTNKLVVQPDGKILVGGFFTSVAGVARRSFVRLLPDGSVDASFSAAAGAGANSSVLGIALLPDGKMYIVGAFTTYDNIARNRIARLNADGSLDASFNPGTGANSTVNAVAVAPNGQVYIGGAFATVNGTARRRLARLNADGSFDTTFNIGTSIFNSVLDIIVQPDGKVLAGGNFSSSTQSFPNAIARFNTNGTRDTSFNPNGLDEPYINEMILLPDGKILIAGQVYLNSPDGVPLTRLNSDGTTDASFAQPSWQPAGSLAYGMALQPDGKILLGGLFNSVNGNSQKNFTRINADGTPDTSFSSASKPHLEIQSIAIGQNGQIITGGSFHRIDNVEATIQGYDGGGNATNFRLLTTAPGYITDFDVQPDGKIIVVGDFIRINGSPRYFAARLNSDGSLDNTALTATPLSDSDIYYIQTVKAQSDGKILVGGAFQKLSGAARSNIARLNPDGSVDSSFITSVEGTVYDIEFSPNNKILIGGDLFSVNGQESGGVRRLNSDGSLDASFSLTGFGDSFAIDVTLQPDGKILFGGFAVTDTDVFSVVRLNPNGTPDPTFMPVGYGGNVYSIALQPDGKIIVGGLYTSLGSTPRNNIGRLNQDGSVDASFNPGTGASGSVWNVRVQSNGKILIGGFFLIVNGQPRSALARLNADGSLDAALPDSAGTGGIYAVEEQADGKIIVAGSFTQFGGLARSGIARLSIGGSKPFDFDGDGKADISVFRPNNGVWYLQQSTSGFTGVAFGISTDKLVPADYDGDGKTDIAVFRDGTWYLQRSQLGFTGVAFGDANDIPMPADYDGDGKADIAVFRPSSGVWYLLQSTAGFTGVAFGQNGDKPVAADYDGDGKADVAVYRGGTWYLMRSTLGFTGIAFGESTDKPVAADYDGDGKADVAVFRPSNGVWYLLQSTAGFTGIAFGLGTDLPTPADYDGDGKTDVAVFRDGNWYLQRSTQGFIGVTFGTTTDKPIPNAFVP